MAFREVNPATIPLEAITWDEIGEAHPRARLLAHVRIGPVDMHLEAWQVEMTEDEQVSVDYPDAFQAMCEREDCFAFQTLLLDGREYVLFAAAYGA